MRQTLTVLFNRDRKNKYLLATVSKLFIRFCQTVMNPMSDLWTVIPPFVNRYSSHIDAIKKLIINLCDNTQFSPYLIKPRYFHHKEHQIIKNTNIIHINIHKNHFHSPKYNFLNNFQNHVGVFSTYRSN